MVQKYLKKKKHLCFDSLFDYYYNVLYYKYISLGRFSCVIALI